MKKVREYEGRNDGNKEKIDGNERGSAERKHGCQKEEMK